MRVLFPLLPFALFSTSCEKSSPKADEETATPIRIETERPLMGTLFKITTFASKPKEGYLAMEKALDLAEEFANHATDYDPDSELNQLTKSPLNSPVKVSDHLFKVLLLGKKITQETNGIFDPTFGPLTHLWRETRRTNRIPSSDEITQARSRCGIQHLSFDEENQTITILHSDLQLDLGGIAKGFAADLIFDYLKKQGYPITLVAAAGDLRLGDPPPDKEGWNIGLRSFRLTPTSTLVLKNCAVSTSGDLFQNVTAQGQKYSHLIDLHTGLGLTTRRAASVILPEAKLTDPLATAACLSDNPKSLLKHYPKASIRVLYENQKIPPITTGLFAE